MLAGKGKTIMIGQEAFAFDFCERVEERHSILQVIYVFTIRTNRLFAGFVAAPK